MLRLQNFQQLKGDYIECDGYTLSIDGIAHFQKHYAITVSLKNKFGKIEDYIGYELLRNKRSEHVGNYVMYQTHNSHLKTEVTLNCMQNKDWFGYMICQMAGNNNWNMQIKPWK